MIGHDPYEAGRTVRILWSVLALSVAVLIGPLVLGIVAPWEPPKAAEDRAVLRVMAPTGEHYTVEREGAWWQFWIDKGSFVAEADEKSSTKDHYVKPTGEGEYDLKVSRTPGRQEADGEGLWPGEMQAVLYVGGETATCDSARFVPLNLAWQQTDGTNGLLTRAICGRYRWINLMPGFVRLAAMVIAPSCLLTIVGTLSVQASVRTDEQRERDRAEKRRKEAELAKHREEEKRRRIESLLRRDAVRDEIGRMTGAEFERFVADLLRQKGYAVQQTRATGDQGVDLLVDIDGKKVAVQLKRWAGPVGNAAVQATFAGMAHYGAEEGWVITTSTFTRSARELAASTRVHLIDGQELGAWLEGLREERES